MASSAYNLQLYRLALQLNRPDLEIHTDCSSGSTAGSVASSRSAAAAAAALGLAERIEGIVSCQIIVGGDDADENFRRDAPGSNNPGNNLHVSGLSHRVDTRDLEQAFAKVGRVSPSSFLYL